MLASMLAVGCTADQASEPLQPTTPPNGPEPVPIEYDEYGQPNATYVSMNTQLQTSYNGATVERRFFEEYSWLPTVQSWNQQRSYAESEKVFTGSVYPMHDIAFASATPTAQGGTMVVRTRQGVNLTASSTPPSHGARPPRPRCCTSADSPGSRACVAATPRGAAAPSGRGQSGGTPGGGGVTLRPECEGRRVHLGTPAALVHGGAASWRQAPVHPDRRSNSGRDHV